MRTSADGKRQVHLTGDARNLVAVARASDELGIESVLVSTAELAGRSSRRPDHAAENRALLALARDMATSPDRVFHRLAETVLTLCQAQSAGISLLGRERNAFHWPAVAGQLAGHLGRGAPRDAIPCGAVLDRNGPLLFAHPERHFPYLGEVTPRVEEALVVPFSMDAEASGTIWAAMHDPGRRFDAEDLRVMTNLAVFAGAAHKTLTALDRAKDADEDLRRTAAALRASERRLHQLVGSMPAAVYTTDATGRITYYNEAASSLWGCEPELGQSEFCGSWKLYWPDGRPMRHDECPMAVTLRTGKAVRGVEAMAERPDGSRVPFLPYPALLRDQAGHVAGAVNMLVDITERKAFERTMLAQTRRFETLNRIAKLLSRDLDLGRIVQTVTDVATELSGAQFGAFFGNVAAEQAERYPLYALTGGSREAFENAIRGDTALFDATFRRIEVVRSDDLRTDERYGPSGHRFETAKDRAVVASYLSVPVGEMGKVHGGLFLGHSRPGVFTQEAEDIVTGIAAHAAIAIDNARLYQIERRLASIVATSDDAIASKDLDGIVTSWNHGAERLFGYAPGEIVGKPVTILIPPDRHDEEAGILERIRRGVRIDHYETVRRRKDGSLVDISLCVSPLKDAEGRVVGASKIARDISERKQAQARQALLTREIHHRTKNLFAVVLAVVARSFAGKATVKDAETAVLSRLQSLAQTHVMLVEKEWQGADIAEVVRTEMEPYTDRVDIEGPAIVLKAQAAQNFALALHELATNAAKYGALSNQLGRVSIGWWIEPDGNRLFRFRWQERGGPNVMPPMARGFGSAVLEQVMSEFFEVPPKIEFAGTGVRYELSGSLETIAEANERAADPACEQSARNQSLE